MQTIPVHKIIRSKRRTLALHINNEAQLIVRAPIKLAESYIFKFIQQKSTWINRKQKLILESKKDSREKTFINGEVFYYCGKSYQLQIYENKNITLGNFLYFPQIFLSNPTKHLLSWYKLEAYTKIKERVLFYAAITQLKFNMIKISNATTRWGSCSHKGNLNFNWRLIMTPLEVIDYVVVHELVHLEIKNHSKKFWDKVDSILPAYKLARKYLKDHSSKLII